MDHAQGVLLPSLHGPHPSLHRTYNSQVGGSAAGKFKSQVNKQILEWVCSVESVETRERGGIMAAMQLSKCFRNFPRDFVFELIPSFRRRGKWSVTFMALSKVPRCHKLA